MASEEKVNLFLEMGFPPEQGELSSAMVYGVARTYSLLYRQLARIYKEYGLTPASFNLLMLLQQGRDAEHATQQAIGECLVVSASDMTGLTDRLEKRGFVRRVAGKDRRAKCLRITEKGTKVLKTIWPRHVEKIKQLNERIGPQEAETALSVLRRLREATQQ